MTFGLINLVLSLEALALLAEFSQVNFTFESTSLGPSRIMQSGDSTRTAFYKAFNCLHAVANKV